ncbi:MAG: helix-turn-helix domain-containing protein [Deltaproteobacteria bacterium]|nr:helix-turn-helix domain-containing protein [Deltaproteobacteria bacterium]
MQRRWISVREAAEYLDLHVKTIYGLVARGTIPFSKISGYGIRIDRKALDRMLEDATVMPRNLILH